jgi:dTDP-4-amino-4,6-dideoxygalactose transaminase
MYYVVCSNLAERTELIKYLKQNYIYTVFHYLSLHKSPYYLDKYTGSDLPNTDRYSDCLLRLPMYYELKTKEVKYVCEKINAFYEKSI